VLAWYVMVNAFNFVLALELQEGLRLTAIRAALAFVPFALAFLAGSLAAGRLAPVLGRGLLFCGALIAVAGFAVLLAVPVRTPYLVTATVVLGIGMGLVQTPLLNVALKGVREEHVGTASGVLSTAQQVGGSVGVALVGVVYFHAVPHGRAAAFSAGCVFGLALVLLSLALLAVLVRPGPAGVRAAGGPR
jgi:MFS family permease